MCIAGGLGATLDTSDKPQQLTDAEFLFSESASRFIVEIEDEHAFLAAIGDIPKTFIGVTADSNFLGFTSNHDNSSGFDLGKWDLTELEGAWRGDVKPDAPIITHRASSPIIDKPSQSRRTPSIRTGAPRALILHANGTNRDREAALACEIAGGEPDIVHVNQLINGEKHLLDYHFLVVPGGFSYGDDLGAGALWALDLRRRLQADVERFVQEGRPTLGICNGFQALVKAGLLPGEEFNDQRSVTLTYNASGHFECRWAYLKPNFNSPSLFLENLDELIYCPVAHGEGRVAVRDEGTADHLRKLGLDALTYVDANGNPVGYPGNPNGSAYDIAALCNPAGNVMGLMPHPENHIFPWQHPRHHRGDKGMLGIKLFENGAKYA
jgi:phosphoribosylformylglycinamidine synthase